MLLARERVPVGVPSCLVLSELPRAPVEEGSGLIMPAALPSAASWATLFAVALLHVALQTHAGRLSPAPGSDGRKNHSEERRFEQGAPLLLDRFWLAGIDPEHYRPS